MQYLQGNRINKITNTNIIQTLDMTVQFDKYEHK